MSVKGKTRELTEERVKQVGLVETNVVAINPTLKEWEEVLGFSVEEGKEEFSYTGISANGNPYLRVDVWLKKNGSEDLFKTVFFLEDRVRMNKDETKTQYINNIGNCSWAEDESMLPSWFAGREYREAYSGEEDFYNFLRTWLGKLDYRDDETELKLNWKKLMKGDVSDLKEQIGGEYATTFVSLATIVTKTKEDPETGEDVTVQYQGIYNRQFLPQYCMKQFRVRDYNDESLRESLKARTPKELKLHEKFVAQVTGDYGCKDFFKLSDIEEYDPTENMASYDSSMITEEEEEEGHLSADY